VSNWGYSNVIKWDLLFIAHSHFPWLGFT
jgi:hypothetical protein